MRILKQLGALRLGLAIAALIALVMRPAAGGTPAFEGWPLVTTLLIPALVPLVFLGLLLDMLMTWVMNLESDPQRKAQPRSVLWVDFALAAALGAAWIPFFLSLGN